nr:hypothetical protein [Tanacetum cinerariifolium]
ALVDKKNVVITEATIRDALRLDDAEGFDCLPNEEIFAELARIGVETPLFEGMLVAGEFEEQGDVEEQDQEDVDNDAAQRDDTTRALDAYVALARRVEHLEYDKVAQALEITKLKRRVKQLERGNKVKVLKLRKLKKVAGDEQVKGRQAEIYQIDMDHALKVLSMQEDEPEVQEVVDVVTTAKLITEVVTAASITIAAAEPQVPPTTITTALVRVVAASTRRRKGVVIRDPEEESTAIISVEMDEEYARKLHEELNKDIDFDVAIDHVKQKAKEDPLDYFKGMPFDDIRPIFEAKFNSNIEFLLKSKEQIEEEENRAIQSINETPSQKEAKRRKLNEEVEDLKQHLEIVPDEDDDVYTEATSLARKVSVVDYEIIHFNNKPHYKIIHADGTHQLYMDKLKSRRIKRTVHGQARVKSWKLLEVYGVHIITFTSTQLTLLVEKRYPLSRFTLDQMLNAVRLRVEEQSKMSLELLRFTRQQHQEGQLE